jgi:drug/metabolite transporter (DMT)-like permease
MALAVLIRAARCKTLNKNLGVILVLVGLVIIVWGAYGFTTRDKVVDIGPIHATKETKHNIPYAPIVGALVLIGGAVMLVSKR